MEKSSEKKITIELGEEELSAIYLSINFTLTTLEDVEVNPHEVTQAEIDQYNYARDLYSEMRENILKIFKEEQTMKRPLWNLK